MDLDALGDVVQSVCRVHVHRVADFAFFMGDMNYRLAIDDEDDGVLRHTGRQSKTKMSELVTRQKNFVFPDIVKLA